MITPYLAPNLSPDKDRNVKSCEKAFARLAETAWTPLGGYPGSDVHWLVRCELCGWEGVMFYSHMRRDKIRHRGCIAVAERPQAIAVWVARQTEETGRAAEAAVEVRTGATAAEGETRGAETTVEPRPPKTA
ncbi:hypothetical protein [Streptomyces jumonjinensis]|uniref:hypothetical protein n=1 Tax=Streptomyces jumonjinensis TaxID=1945 RepID=UPI003796B656